MKKIMLCTAALALATAAPFAPLSAKAPEEIEGLYRVPSKLFQEVYLLPGVNFRPYTKVMFDTPEVAFKKNWQQNYNDTLVGLEGRVTNQDAQRILNAARNGLGETFAKTFAAGGYQIVTTPGPDVLRLKTYLLNLDVVAPDVMTPGIEITLAPEAGSATLVIEARDSQTGALLGTALDTREIGASMGYVRNSVTNRADFEMAFRRWAKISLDALNELKRLSPYQTPPAG